MMAATYMALTYEAALLTSILVVGGAVVLVVLDTVLEKTLGV